ncbi:MAG: Homoserine kinase [Alphaproteobacteria bacterium MarineAlpha9_Bin3]|nr:MAG: Homoserine kinase [Alphaproteobacteria bacterium MarineAlpha9_Bin3]|tara:strand:- start:8105 stop:9088 length:984 start_codon:yes stop_codon:yes gene_type:complete
MFMAHLTNLKQTNIDKIIFNYNILNFINITPIYDGIQNSNYIINTKNKKYILTIFEDKYVKKNINFFLKLLFFCKNNHFNCPSPILDRNDDFINFIDNKPSCIFNFIEGKSYNSKVVNIKSVGMELANLHLITKNFDHKIKMRFNIIFFNNVIKKYNSYFLKKNPNLIKIFNKTLYEYSNLTKLNLPKAIIHGDLFPDNVLFKNKNTISGFLDFYFSDYNYLISDLAIVIISWCFITDAKNKFVLNYEKINTLLKGYNSIRNIQISEIDALIIICKIYCMRFMFTRLLSINNNYDKNKILIKNPNEYIKKLLYFNNETNFRMKIDYE